MENIIHEIQVGVKNGNAQIVKDKVELALHNSYKPETIIQKGLIEPMNIIGKGFRTGENFVPEVLRSSRAMHAGLYILKLVLCHEQSFSKGLIVIGTVAGDLHDIGKNMVAMILESAGYTVIDLGIDVPAKGFIDAIYKYQPDILALSALLTTTMGEQREVVRKIREEGLHEKTKILIGGGPVTYDYARAIGADGYARDLFEAIDRVDELMEVIRMYSNIIKKPKF